MNLMKFLRLLFVFLDDHLTKWTFERNNTSHNNKNEDEKRKVYKLVIPDNLLTDT